MFRSESRTPLRQDFPFRNRRNGSHPGRVIGLSDGVFGFALTLLVLSLEIPSDTPADRLGQALTELLPMVSAFVVSVAVVGIFWYAHHKLFDRVAQVDTVIMVLNLIYLSLVVLIPFAQRLQGDYPLVPLPYVIYAGILVVLVAMEALLRRHIHRRGLARPRWSWNEHRNEMLRSLVLIAGFSASIPAAFVLLNWTVLLWFSMLPLDYALSRWSR